MKSKKNIVLLYEHTAREYDSLLKLKTRLENFDGVNCFLYSRRYQIDKILILSIKENIDVLVLPYVYKESSFNPFQFLFWSKNKVKVVNLSHEQVRAEFNELPNMPKGHLACNMVKHFVWSDYYKRKLFASGVPSQNIIVTGNIRIDKIEQHPSESDRIAFSVKYGLDPNKRWIIYFESADNVYSENEIRFLINQGYIISDIERRNLEAINIKRHLFADFDKIDKSFFDKYELIYRAHPGVNASKQKNKFIKTISEGGAYEWLRYIDAVISAKSTVLLESAFFNTKAIRYDPIGVNKRQLTFGLENILCIKSLTDIPDAIKNSIVDLELSQKYLGKADSNAINKTADSILDVCNAKLDNFIKINITPYGLLFVLRKFMLSMFVTIVMKTGCIAVLNKSQKLKKYLNDFPLPTSLRINNNGTL